ncbi:putative F420-0 ABC transporter substrate-binding protein [Ruania zhangjianzhongii]|uniref:putative F420-0 ABC transporter substrate-binding protein n=1 Tax=Ruania zhangjianzhongii TaxID=2603206 RepID=UPI0011C788EE|nr:putative F420-0 ABC transporter substrate-binding protein [Ruania zhangjianzhongii]
MPRRAPIAAAVLAFLTVTACSTADGGASPDEEDVTSSGGAASADTGGYPLTVDNCGTEVTVDAPPQRIVTIKSTSTELVLALGLADRLVGTAFADGPLPDDLAEAGGEVPVLAERAPSSEVVLAAEPDFVLAGWESNFSADSAGERSELTELGIATYVNPAACLEEDYQPNPLTYQHIFDDILEAGDLLGAPEGAEALVAEQRDALAQVQPSSEDLTALWYSSGSDIPYVGGGIGAPQLLLETVGLQNIMADVEESWASGSWEAIAAQNPDVIVLVDSAWNTAEHKIEVLESSPVTSTMDAVIDERYLVLPFPASEAGVRSAPAAVDLADQLADLTGQS